MFNLCPDIGVNVIVKTFDDPVKGIIVDKTIEYPSAGSLNGKYRDEVCSVRLANGNLIDKVYPNELEEIKQQVST